MEQQNKYHVIVSERATQMLVSHVAFLAQVSPEAAERLTAEFEKTANSSEFMPQRCSWIAGRIIVGLSDNNKIIRLGIVTFI